MAMQPEHFTIRQVGTSGREIRDPDGDVIGWVVDESWAMVIAGLLEPVERGRASLRDGPANHGPTTLNVLT